jgi:hypothetical protein
VQLTSIHVALVENGKVVQGDDKLLTDLLERSGDTELKVGKTYDEILPPTEDPDKVSQTDPLTVEFALKDQENGAVTGDETNVIVVYECAPVSYNADGTVAPAIWTK